MSAVITSKPKVIRGLHDNLLPAFRGNKVKLCKYLGISRNTLTNHVNDENKNGIIVIDGEVYVRRSKVVAPTAPYYALEYWKRNG